MSLLRGPWLVFLIFILPFAACESASPPLPTLNIEATIEAVVADVLPTNAPVTERDFEATIEARVKATTEAQPIPTRRAPTSIPTPVFTLPPTPTFSYSTSSILPPTPSVPLPVTPTPVAPPTLPLIPTVTFTFSPTSSPTPMPAPQVRVVYAIPTDREYQEQYVAAVAHAVQEVQGWYAAQLDGYTFAIAEPAPEVCALEHESAYYEKEWGWNRVIRDLQPCAPIGYDSSEYVWIVYPDVDFDCEQSELGRGGGGITILHRGDLDGLLSPVTYRHCGFGPRAPLGWIGGLGP